MSEIEYLPLVYMHTFLRSAVCIYSHCLTKRSKMNSRKILSCFLAAFYRPYYYATHSLHVEIMVPMVFPFGSNNGIFIYSKVS